MDASMQSRPPRLMEAEAICVGRELFGVEADAGKSLGSERDQVWLLLRAGARVAVLKVANEAESTATLDMEAGAAMLAAQLDDALPVALPRASLTDGNVRALWTARDGGAKHWVRCYSVLSGGHHSAEDGPLPDSLLQEWGATSARLARTLRGFQHPAALTRKLPWDGIHTSMPVIST
jgi:Ser/Thr protein kinase RdoA (MazF antagonist)